MRKTKSRHLPLPYTQAQPRTLRRRKSAPYAAAALPFYSVAPVDVVSNTARHSSLHSFAPPPSP